MRRSISIILAATLLWMGAVAPLWASELSLALSPLIKPDSESVRQALENLDAIAKAQSGNAKVRTQRLATAVRNLFQAEDRLRRARADANAAERTAKSWDLNAAGWMRPNVFGRTNPQAARDAKQKAAAIRSKAARKVANAREHLAAQCRELEVVMRNFQDLGDLRLVVLLGQTLHTVIARSLKGYDYKSSFPPEAIARLEKNTLQQKKWRQLAREAEKNHAYEIALHYFTMAGDFPSARRCAAALAPELLDAGLAGSAIEAFELAGNPEEVRRIRAKHPELGAMEFRVLPAEELLWRVSTSCVEVLDDNRRPTGLGFFFRRGGYILTLRSILPEHPRNPSVRLSDGRVIAAQRLATPKSSGLAILRVPVLHHQFLTIARNSEIRATTRAFLPTRPSPAAPTTLAPVHIKQPTPLPPSAPQFRIDKSAPAGTPVTDDRGRVLGIINSPSPAHPSSSAIPADTIRNFVGRNADPGFSFQ